MVLADDLLESKANRNVLSQQALALHMLCSRPYRVKYVCRTKLDLVKSREIVNRIIKVTLDTPEKLNLLKSPPRRV